MSHRPETLVIHAGQHHEPTTGAVPLAEREIVLEIVGASSVERHDGACVVEDELLSTALRIDLGLVNLGRGADIVLPGLSTVVPDTAGETFPILDAAEIEYTTKQVAWMTIERLDGLALARSLAALDLPQDLRDALLERAAATRPW